MVPANARKRDGHRPLPLGPTGFSQETAMNDLTLEPLGSAARRAGRMIVITDFEQVPGLRVENWLD